MLKVYPLILLQAVILTVIRSQILAIDYGTQFIKASLVHVGAGKAFSIVENPKSQRKFINSVIHHLYSLGSIMKSVSIKPILYQRDQEVLVIVSSTPTF
jgi:hypothetical protein